MSKTKESLLGYASVPVIVSLVMMGFMLMISTVFMGIPDFAEVEVHPPILFPVFVIAVLVWGLGVLCSLNYVICGSFGLGSENPKIRFTLKTLDPSLRPLLRIAVVPQITIQMI